MYSRWNFFHIQIIAIYCVAGTAASTGTSVRNIDRGNQHDNNTTTHNGFIAYIFFLKWYYSCKLNLKNRLIWAHKTSLILPLFIEAPVSSQECARSFCLFLICLKNFETVTPLVFFFSFHFNNIYEQKSNSYLDSSDVADCVAFAILPDKRNEINTILKLHTNIRQG